MKKTYVSPVLDAVKFDTLCLMSGSLGIYSDEKKNASQVLSNSYQGGFLWEDDTNVAE